MFHQSTFGFVFKEREFGEADKIFSIFSKDFGRIEVLGKSIRKVSSKLKFGIEIFSLSQIEFVQGKFQKILVGVQPFEKYKNLKKNLKKLIFAFKISEVLDSLIKGEEKDERIYGLIKEVFSKLNSLSFKKEEVLYLYFFWNLLSFLGFKPQIDFCFFCKEKEDSNFYFDFTLSNLVCEKCSKNVKIGKRIDKDSLKLLKVFLKGNIDLLERLKSKKETINSVFLLSQEYFKFLAEKNED